MLTFRWVDVFGAQPLEGAAVPVAIDADALDDVTLQRVARELGTPQTAFLCAPRRSDCDARVRIFTPRRELALPGTASLAAAHGLGRGSVVLEHATGSYRVDRTARGYRVHLDRPLVGAPLEEARPLARAAFSLSASSLDPALEVVAASAGFAFLCVPVVDTDALATARVRVDAWDRLREGARVLGAIVFAPVGDGSYAQRVFFPGAAHVEEPATASAAAALGARLLVAGRTAAGTLRVAQGGALERTALLEVEVDGDTDGCRAVRVAGTARTAGKLELDY